MRPFHADDLLVDVNLVLRQRHFDAVFARWSRRPSRYPAATVPGRSCLLKPRVHRCDLSNRPADTAGTCAHHVQDTGRHRTPAGSGEVDQRAGLPLIGGVTDGCRSGTVSAGLLGERDQYPGQREIFV